MPGGLISLLSAWRKGACISSSTEGTPVLLDIERKRISSDLRLSTDRIDEAVSAVMTRLAASAASVTLQLFLSGHKREFRETAYASWVMMQSPSACSEGNAAALDYHQLKASLGEPKSAVP